MKRFISKILLIAILFNISFPAFSETSTSSDAPVEFSEDELPQALKDLRRFEIISLGSLPFVMLDTTLAYSCIRYAMNDFNQAYMPNPFASSDQGGLTQDEQIGVLLTSLGICVSIGLTDFLVRLISRNIKKNKAMKNKNNDILITPISEDPDAVKIEIDSDKTESELSSENQNIEISNKEATLSVGD